MNVRSQVARMRGMNVLLGDRAQSHSPPPLPLAAAQALTQPEREAETLSVPEPAPLAARLQADPEEARWLLRARQGDTAAFEWLMNRYRDRALRLAAHILRQPAEAEDLVQEAFVRAFVQIGHFRGEAAFYTWLYTIIVHLALNRRRQPQWQREWELEVETQALPDASSSALADRYETRQLVETLLDSLSPPLRAALALRELEGLEYAEIADALQIPVGTVRSRLNAARAQFRELWERVMEEIAHV